MFRPAGSVSLYLPNRSTMPARACGMIRTVRASITTTNRTTRISRAYTTSMAAPSLFGGPDSGHQLAHGVDVRRGAADREHLDRRPGRDREGLVVRAGRPDLARQLDASRVVGRELLGDDRLLSDEPVGAGDQIGPGVQLLDQVGAHQREHRRRAAGREQDLE